DRRIVCGCLDKTVRILDAKTGQERLRCTGHQGAVYTAVFAPDGTQILSGGQDLTVRLWDAERGHQLHRIAAKESGSIWSVAFSRAGRFGLSAGTNRWADLPLLPVTFEQAVADLTTAIQLNPSSTIAYVHRGQCYELNQRPGQAMADFDRAIELDKKCLEAYL